MEILESHIEISIDTLAHTNEMAAEHRVLPSYDDHAPPAESMIDPVLRQRVELEVMRQELLKEQEKMRAEREELRLKTLYESRNALVQKFNEEQRQEIDRIRPSWSISYSGSVYYTWCDRIMKDHMVLYWLQSYNKAYNDLPYGMITSKGVYRIYSSNTLIAYYGNVNKNTWHIAPLYLFSRLLDEKDLERLDQLISGNSPMNAGNQSMGSVVSRMLFRSEYSFNNNDYHILKAERLFESIVRLTPGEYRNGPWQQLDGFFGAYYNPVTNQVIDTAPPLE